MRVLFSIMRLLFPVRAVVARGRHGRSTRDPAKSFMRSISQWLRTPAARVPVQVLHDLLRVKQQPGLAGQFPDPVTGMLHGLVLANLVVPMTPARRCSGAPSPAVMVSARLNRKLRPPQFPRPLLVRSAPCAHESPRLTPWPPFRHQLAPMHDPVNGHP